ncbi:hypothetical protein FOJ82_11720 [Tessaracoccus rhinocerotis]|uniref:Uncharacterized protein n=1 Tax=Tessaracoccus rhinocerotis TaxID=1689449 RepID=A0A553JXR5_9ACTN|nr:hypothetical protein [Tessaracoccus rhinocerotis]TRY17222.1 hypothetical protein FOJ82_11720 [Tessaracoccus rhinocerotis]
MKIASKDGRTVYLWRCGSNVHAQLVNASTGDLVFLRTAGGTSLGGARVPSGKTSVNSGSYSLAQTGVVKACVTPTNRSEWCTSYYVAIV